MQRVGWKSRAASAVRSWVGVTGQRERKRAGAAIVLYHGIVPRITHASLETFCIDVSTFRSHLGFFKKRFFPISLSDLLAALSSGEKINSDWIVITLDDSIKCQVTLGASILDDYRIPWALCVPTGFVGKNRSIWTYELSFLIFRCWQKEYMRLPLDSERVFPTRNEKEKRLALLEIRNILMGLGRNECLRVLNRLISSFGWADFFDRFKSYGSFEMATWRELEYLARNGVEILSHGHYHLSHSPALEDWELEQEVKQSFQTLGKYLHSFLPGFALPYGRHDKRTGTILGRMGFSFCLTSQPGRVGSESSMFSLPRMDGEYSLRILRHHMLRPIIRTWE